MGFRPLLGYKPWGVGWMAIKMQNMLRNTFSSSVLPEMSRCLREGIQTPMNKQSECPWLDNKVSSQQAQSSRSDTPICSFTGKWKTAVLPLLLLSPASVPICLQHLKAGDWGTMRQKVCEQPCLPKAHHTPSGPLTLFFRGQTLPMMSDGAAGPNTLFHSFPFPQPCISSSGISGFTPGCTERGLQGHTYMDTSQWKAPDQIPAGIFLCGICIFSLCMRGFPSPHSSKTCFIEELISLNCP